MALTLEALFSAYMNTGEYEEDSLDFAEDIYNWFGLPEGGIGAKDFADKYSMYIPTYDPSEEAFAVQDKYLAFRNAGETHNLSKALTEELYSTEMKNVSGALEKEVAKGKQMAGQLGLRSGTLESAMEETMDVYSGKAKDIGRQYDLKEQGDLDAYNVKMVDATLDYEKDEHQIKRDFYDKVLASVARLAAIGAFDQPSEDTEFILIKGEGCPEEALQANVGFYENEEGTCINPSGEVWSSGWYEEYGSTEDCKCFYDLQGRLTGCFPEGCDPDF